MPASLFEPIPPDTVASTRPERADDSFFAESRLWDERGRSLQSLLVDRRAA